MKHHRLAAAGVAIAAIGAGLLTATPASAGKIKTFVVVTQPGPFAFDGQNGPTFVTVQVGLDEDSCLHAFTGGQSYTIAAKTDNAAVATVSPSVSGVLQCGDTAPFTITGVGNGGATIQFDAVSSPGLQSQVTNAHVQITAQKFGTSPVPNPDGHVRPGAPAVANGFLRANPDQAETCKTFYDTKHWHGQLIRAVAKWAADNHLGKAKQSMSDNDWMTKVENEVIDLCS